MCQLGAVERPSEFFPIGNDLQRREPITDDLLIRFRVLKLSGWFDDYPFG